MELSETSSAIIQALKGKAYDLSYQSDDPFILVSWKVFNAFLLLLKSCPNSNRRALDYLEKKKCLTLSLEEFSEPTIRSLLFGLIGSVRLALLHLSKLGVSSNNSLSVVEVWKKKAFGFLLKSDDQLTTVLCKGFEAISEILKDSANSVVQDSLKSLHIQRVNCQHHENPGEISLRTIMYGVVESIHLVLLHYIEMNNKTRSAEENYPQMDECYTQVIDAEIRSSTKGTTQYSTKREESVTKTSDTEQEYPENEDSVKSIAVEKRNRPAKYNEHVENSDEDEQPLKKIPKSEATRIRDKGRNSSSIESSRSLTVSKENRATDGNGAHIKCPECDHYTRSVSGWNKHLKSKHDTTPMLAGFAVRCECGYESFSHQPSRHQCDISKFTVIRKGNGPIRRLSDDVVAPLTPKCLICEKFPSTTCGYVYHLKEQHKTCLSANGVYLKCSCGFPYTSHHSQANHDKKCDGRLFSLHRVDEE